MLPEDQLIKEVVDSLIKEDAAGWFQGRMEFGPRALGSRSILGNPLSKNMQRNLNLKVKYRESFRPFAPSVLEEKVDQWFDFAGSSPYMLMVAEVLKKHRKKGKEADENAFGIDKLNQQRSIVPAITHVDYSARIQTVSKNTNRRYHKLISEFEKQTGCPMLINTSFNVRGEPIVCTPEDAFRCFMGTELDILAIGNCLLRKEHQSSELKEDYKDKFELD